MSARRTAERRDGGFTLVEVLVSLALIALITIFVANGFDHTRRVAALSEELDGAMTIEAIRGYLAQSLANAYAPPPPEGGDRPAAPFAGGTDEIVYLAPSDGLLDRGGLYRIALAGGETQIVLSRQPYPADGAAPGDRPRIVEAGGLKLRYWGLAVGEEAPRWHQAWEDQEALPLLVEIRLEPAARRAVWPPLIVRLLQGG